MSCRHWTSQFLVAGVMLVGGCAGPGGSEAPAVSFADEQLIPQINTWVNQLGLAQTDPGVWGQRLSQACTEGVWDDEIAGRLAKQFIEEDLALSIGGDASVSPSAEEGARALWMMAVNVCPADFPDGEIENGLP